jgi:hypothetical protein
MSYARKMFSISLLTIIGFLGASVPLRADEAHERCERRIHKAEEKLRIAVRRYGEHSRQAHKRHEQLEEERRRCGYRDHDHDRDHDRDHDHGQS